MSPADVKISPCYFVVCCRQSVLDWSMLIIKEKKCNNINKKGFRQTRQVVPEWNWRAKGGQSYLQCHLPGTEQFLQLCSAWLVMLREAETTGRKATGESKLFGRLLMYLSQVSDVMLLNSCCVVLFQRWPGSGMLERAVFSKSGVWGTRYWFLTVSTLEPSPSQFSGSTRQFLTHLKMLYCYYT